MHQTSRESGGYGKLKARGGGRTLQTQIIQHQVFHPQREKQRDGKSNHTLANLSDVPSVSWLMFVCKPRKGGIKKKERERKHYLELLEGKLPLCTQIMMGGPFKFKFSESIKTISAGWGMEGQWRAFIPPEGLCIPAGHESTQSAELQLRQWVLWFSGRRRQPLLAFVQSFTAIQQQGSTDKVEFNKSDPLCLLLQKFNKRLLLFF